MINCCSRIRQNKPLTWKNKKIKFKFHSSKILALTDFGEMEEARELQEKIDKKAR
jgi:hypothetical protein